MCLRGLRVNVKSVAFGKLTLADDKPGDRSTTEEDPISLLPDVLFCGMAFVDWRIAKGGYQGRDLVLLSAEKRIPYTGGDPSGGTRLLNELAADTTEDSPYLFPFLEGMKTGEDATRNIIPY